jgi:hypothetical protein
MLRPPALARPRAEAFRSAAPSLFSNALPLGRLCGFLAAGLLADGFLAAGFAAAGLSLRLA